MGKKTNKDKNDIRLNLDIQMNLAGDIACRNPKIKALQEKYNNGLFTDELYRKEFDRLFKEIYGEVFPRFAFPVWRLEQFERDAHELILSIDLNYTKDEIMFIVEKYVANEAEKYRNEHTVKHKRKKPAKWIEYLEVWDLKDGDPPWIKVGSTKLPYELAIGKEGKQGDPWTYEEIAKHLYPNEQTQKEVKKAIDRVKKQYRAAYRLICGKKYDPREIEYQKAKNKEQGSLCDQCPDKHCKETGEACPRLLEELEKLEVKQQHLLVSKVEQLDIERYKTTGKKYPTADEQFR